MGEIIELNTVVQLPLPDTSHVPAWVKAALDSYTSPCGRQHLTGFNVLIRGGSNPPLNAYPTHRAEHQALRNLRSIALKWQVCGFRSWLSALERDVDRLECQERKKARAIINGEGYAVYDDNGNNTFDDHAIMKAVQARLMRESRVNLSLSEIRDILDMVEVVQEVCDMLNIEVSYQFPAAAKVKRVA